MFAVVFGNCGVGSSLKFDGMMNRTVDFSVLGNRATFKAIAVSRTFCG